MYIVQLVLHGVLLERHVLYEARLGRWLLPEAPVLPVVPVLPVPPA